MLALRGGTPTRTLPFPEWPVFDHREEEALVDALRSGHWGTLGPKVTEFERRFAAYLGAGHVQTVCNGTIALEAILRALDIGPGDEVIVPPYTFIATATAVLMAGATPVFADIDPATNNLLPDAAEAAIGPRTKAVMPVYVAGVPADLDSFVEVARRNAIHLIEDAAQAHGSEWRGRKVGSFGIGGAFSFQASKNMTAGEGGAVATDDGELAARLWSVHHVGRRREGQWYEHHELGSNYRMTEFQAAVLLAQLERLDAQMERRDRNARRLDAALSEIDGISVFVRDPRATRIAHHLYMFRFHSEAFGGLPKERFVEALAAEGIPVAAGYTEIQKQPLFKSAAVRRVTSGFDYSEIVLPQAERACAETVWIEQNALLGDDGECDDIVRAISRIREHYRELL